MAFQVGSLQGRLLLQALLSRSVSVSSWAPHFTPDRLIQREHKGEQHKYYPDPENGSWEEDYKAGPCSV